MPLKNAGCYTVFVRSLHSSFFLENPNRRTKGYNLFVFTRKKNQQRICIVIAQAITLPIFQCRKRSRVLRNCKSSTMVIKTFFEDDMFCYIIFVSAKKRMRMSTIRKEPPQNVMLNNQSQIKGRIILHGSLQNSM